MIGSYHNIFRVGALLQDLGFWILNDVIRVPSATCLQQQVERPIDLGQLPVDHRIDLALAPHHAPEHADKVLRVGLRAGGAGRGVGHAGGFAPEHAGQGQGQQHPEKGADEVGLSRLCVRDIDAYLQQCCRGAGNSRQRRSQIVGDVSGHLAA